MAEFVPREFFDRNMSVSVGALLIEALEKKDTPARHLLKVNFRVELSIASAPNKAKLEIYNLAQDNRKRVQEKGAEVIISAGYGDFTEIIFKGQVTYASTTRSGPDWITTVNAGDGQQLYKQARINENFPPGTTLGTVLKKLGERLGVDPGNLLAKAAKGSQRKGITEWLNGGTLSGKLTSKMDEVAKTMGYQWSIQQGSLLLLEIDELIQPDLVVLSPVSGLLGSPDVGEDGTVDLESLLNGKLQPGHGVRINSNQVNGDFKIMKAVHNGDTWGPDWNTSLEVKPLG